jgi:uncharacterized protein with PQ loop repeat
MLTPEQIKLTTKKKRNPTDKVLDRVVMIVSVLYPMSAVPQLIRIIQGDAHGVSTLSWLSFFVCAGLFLIYGLRHRVMPMIISNILWVVIDGLVVASLVMTHIS